jgi:hypothetical protein
MTTLADMTDSELMSRRDGLAWDLRFDADLRSELADVEDEIRRRREALTAPVSVEAGNLGEISDRTPVRAAQGSTGAARGPRRREPT